MILLIAGNEREAHYWARELKLKEWKYVRSIEDLCGVPIDTKLKYVGTWYISEHALKLDEYARAHGLSDL